MLPRSTDWHQATGALGYLGVLRGPVACEVGSLMCVDIGGGLPDMFSILFYSFKPSLWVWVQLC